MVHESVRACSPRFSKGGQKIHGQKIRSRPDVPQVQLTAWQNPWLLSSGREEFARSKYVIARSRRSLRRSAQGCISSTGKAHVIAHVEGIGSGLADATLDRNGASATLDDELKPADLEAVRLNSFSSFLHYRCSRSIRPLAHWYQEDGLRLRNKARIQYNRGAIKVRTPARGVCFWNVKH